MVCVCLCVCARMYVCVYVCIYLWPDLSFINNRDVGIIESHQVILYGMLLLSTMKPI